MPNRMQGGKARSCARSCRDTAPYQRAAERWREQRRREAARRVHQATDFHSNGRGSRADRGCGVAADDPRDYDPRAYMSRCLCVRLGILVAAAMVPPPVSAHDRTFVVIVPAPPRPSPPPPRIFSPQPPLQWMPPPALGLTPGIPSPTARCYAGRYVCTAAQPEHLGERCTCATSRGPVTGQILIPPSRPHPAPGNKSDEPAARPVRS